MGKKLELSSNTLAESLL